MVKNGKRGRDFRSLFNYIEKKVKEVLQIPVEYVIIQNAVLCVVWNTAAIRNEKKN